MAQRNITLDQEETIAFFQKIMMTLSLATSGPRTCWHIPRRHLV